MDIFGTVATCIHLAHRVYDQYQLVAANKATCKRLAERVHALVAPLEGLKRASGNGPSPSLKRMNRALEVAGDYVDRWIYSLRREGKLQWLKTAAKASFEKEKLIEIYKDLDEARGDLQFAMTFALTISTDEWVSDKKEDYQELQGTIQKMMDDKDAKDEQRYLALAGMLSDLRTAAAACSTAHDVFGFTEINYLKDLHFEPHGGLMGAGGFGEIKAASYNGVPVAIKTFRSDIRVTHEELEEMRNEVKMHATLTYPHIVTLWGACTVPPTLCIVMERAEHGSLFDQLHGPIPGGAFKGDDAATWGVKLALLLDVADGVGHLHSNAHLLHGDLKSPNVLVCLMYGQCVAKICDFGHSKPYSMTGQTGQHTRTYNWMAPEALPTPQYTTAADIYSLGMIIYEIVFGKVPFDECRNHDELVASLARQQRPAQANPREWANTQRTDTRFFSNDVFKLMMQCWAESISERPSIDDVLTTLRSIADATDADHKQGCPKWRAPGPTLLSAAAEGSPVHTAQAALLTAAAERSPARAMPPSGSPQCVAQPMMAAHAAPPYDSSPCAANSSLQPMGQVLPGQKPKKLKGLFSQVIPNRKRRQQLP
ncbi:kinase-like domain-containing protein [Tribonema minus]|uniref:Kinase-like domain-containing protein n=1 Tax=Tribonema minus TaxID=303371 RepID=A0A835ZPF1_9STRA|nr:kinase-like domain-containing protein [Tribonema minus]